MPFSAAPTVNTQVGAVTPPPTGDMVMTTQNFAEYTTWNGTTVRFNFNVNVQVGKTVERTVGNITVGGSPIIYSDQEVRITSITPASVVDSRGDIMNGVVQDPFLDPTVVGNVRSARQGWDQALENNAEQGSTVYLPTLNLHPSAHSNGDIVVPSGSNTTFTMLVRSVDFNPVKTGGSNRHWRIVEEYVHFTFLSAIPGADLILPSPSATTKELFYFNAMATDIYSSFAPPVDFDFANAEEALEYLPPDMGLYGLVGEYGESFRMDAAYNNSGANYPQELAPGYNSARAMKHASTITQNEREALMLRSLEHAIQVKGLMDTHNYNTPTNPPPAPSMNGLGAGRRATWHAPLYELAFATGRSDILADARTFKTSMTDQSRWAKDIDVGAYVKGGESGNPRAGQVFSEEMVDVPFILPDDFTSRRDGDYTRLAIGNAMWEQIPVAMLKNGPGGVSGVDAMLDGPFDTTNPKAASLAFASRHNSANRDADSLNYLPTHRGWDDLHSFVKANCGFPNWTGVPDQLPWDDYFTATAGGVDHDLQGDSFATETVTSVDRGISLDKVQYIDDLDVGTSGSKTGLLRGVKHWGRLRQNSASGSGPWSRHIPDAHPPSSGLDVNTFTPTGTEAASAPVNTVAPVIHALRHTETDYEEWGPVTGSLAQGQMQLAAGFGYWSGFPAPDYTLATFSWRRGATVVGSAQKYTATAADAGSDLVCDVTPVGGPTVTTAAVSVPALAVLPATSLVDMDFKGNTALDYETELAAMISANCTTRLVPSEKFWSGLTGVNTGGLWLDKTSPRPEIVLPFKNQAVAGTTYNYTVQIVVGWQGRQGFQDFRNRSVNVEIRSGSNVYADLSQTNIAQNADFHPVLVEFTGSFSVAGGETDLDLEAYVQINANTGGANSGDGYLTRLLVEEA